MNANQLFITAGGVTLLVIVFGLARTLAPTLVAAAKTQAEALLTREQRDTLYGAVKAGLNVAAGYGLSGDDLVNKAATVASKYVQKFGVQVSAEFLIDLIKGEQAKRQGKV